MKHRKETIQVRCDGNRPIAFRRPQRKACVIERLLRVWVVQTGWWGQEKRCTYYEVVASGGVYLLCRTGDTWQLLGLYD